MMAGFVSIDSPCSEYSGKTTRSMVPGCARALADHVDDAARLRREVGRRRDDRQLQLHEADDDAVGRLVQAT